MIRDVTFSKLVNPKFVKPVLMRYEQSGVNKSWELVEVHDSVAVLLADPVRREFVLVKQFRPAVFLKHSDGFTYELCAGIVDKDKTLEQIAIEEVYEETGYAVDSVEKIVSFYTSVGFASSRQTLFFAHVSDAQKKGKGGGVDTEEIEIVRVGFDEINEFIFDEQKPKTTGILFAFYWYMDKFGGKQGKLREH